MSFQVPCPVGSFEVEGQAALQLVSQAARSLSSGRGVLVGRFVGRPKIRIPDTALGGGEMSAPWRLLSLGSLPKL